MNTLNLTIDIEKQGQRIENEDVALELFAEELPTVSDFLCGFNNGCCWSTASTSLSCGASTASTCCPGS